MMCRQEQRAAMSSKSLVCAAMTGLILSAAPAYAEEPVLRIAKQGSMEAGGKTINCATNDGGDANSQRWPSGHVVVDNVYATYQYPADQRHPFPILFNSGGGHTARVYDTTPDGREGWLTLFLRQGFPVYGVDRPNTGRSGTDICKINAVKLGGPGQRTAAHQSLCGGILLGDLPLGAEIRRTLSQYAVSGRIRRHLLSADDQHLS